MPSCFWVASSTMLGGFLSFGVLSFPIQVPVKALCHPDFLLIRATGSLWVSKSSFPCLLALGLGEREQPVSIAADCRDGSDRGELSGWGEAGLWFSHWQSCGLEVTGVACSHHSLDGPRPLPPHKQEGPERTVSGLVHLARGAQS